MPFEQLGLLGPPADLPQSLQPGRRPSRKGLLLAIFPSPDDAGPIARQAGELRQQHGLTGSCLATGRLHVTLMDLGEYLGQVPAALIEAATSAAASVRHDAFDVVLDHAMSFPASSAYVLLGPRNPAIDLLRARLVVALKNHGVKPLPSRNPHMTLLYDDHHVARHDVEPVTWRAHEFVLVLSHRGEKRHEWLARWPLASLPEGDQAPALTKGGTAAVNAAPR